MKCCFPVFRRSIDFSIITNQCRIRSNCLHLDICFNILTFNKWTYLVIISIMVVQCVIIAHSTNDYCAIPFKMGWTRDCFIFTAHIICITTTIRDISPTSLIVICPGGSVLTLKTNSRRAQSKSSVHAFFQKKSWCKVPLFYNAFCPVNHINGKAAWNHLHAAP